MDELHLASTGAHVTQLIGRTLAGQLRAGDVVSLGGELGAGKTCLVQGAAAGLEVAEPVVSPTFVLVRQYHGRLPVVHCDVYRLDRLGDVLELGDEVFAPDVVTFVEWGDAIAALLPDDRVDVELRVHHDGTAEDAAHAQDGGPDREVVVRLHGRAASRAAVLRAAFDAAGLVTR